MAAAKYYADMLCSNCFAAAGVSLRACIIDTALCVVSILALIIVPLLFL